MITKYTDYIKEAIETPCQTLDAVYNTKISNDSIEVNVTLPFELNLSEEDAKILEANLHNAVELVLKPYFNK